MSAHLSLKAQEKRWHKLNDGPTARYLRIELARIVKDARQFGLRIEIKCIPDGRAMGSHHEEITVTPSREGYQSTD